MPRYMDNKLVKLHWTLKIKVKEHTMIISFISYTKVLKVKKFQLWANMIPYSGEKTKPLISYCTPYNAQSYQTIKHDRSSKLLNN